MGKHALVVLCAAFAVFLTSLSMRAQDAAPPTTPPTGVKTGTFFTADDLEHLDAALGYVNLTRDQLSFEKKHRDDKLRLKVCDAALDDPLGLPLTAEIASNQFALRTAAAQRCQYAGQLLDLPQQRWSAEELAQDSKEYAEALNARAASSAALAKIPAGDPSRKKMEADDQALADKVRANECAALLGGTPTWLGGLPPRNNEGVPRLLSSEFVAASGALKSGAVSTVEELKRLGFRAPEWMSEDAKIAVPGCDGTVVPEGWDIFAAGARLPLASHLVAASRCTIVIEYFAANAGSIYGAGPNQPQPGISANFPGVTGGVVAAWQSPWGKVVIGGTGPNTYEGDDFIAIIDLGGDDVYKGRVACGLGLPGHSPISFVLDLGGNDQYLGEDFTQGFGFNGVGILWDLGGGNDIYRARYCSQACGLCGYGELYDDGGDETYMADSGAQGAAAFGYGHLIDAKGNDSYRGARYVQAFAQVMGVGVLTDGAGNDLYFAGAKYLHLPLWNDRYQSLSQGFAIGNRYGATGGGVALLLDEGDGNDVYQSDIYGQGSSYWFSLGMLVDRGGNDTYTSGQYCQGVGIHLSAGILVDLSGNDTYVMGVGLGQGAAHDWGVGWLIDRAGNDMYQGNGQGMGLNFSVAILLDCAGDDSHSTNNDGSIGKGSNNDISLLIDLGGYDVYGPKEIKDSQATKRDRHALVYDVPEGWFPSIDQSTWPTKQDPPPQKARVQHILIAWDGTGVDTQKQKRTKEEATVLMKQVLRNARSKGADWKQLQTDFNEDSGDQPEDAHNTYDVTPTARLVKPFLDLSLKLGVGQIDVCESKYGWHIIKRVE
ncbi:MAG: peptidylprolyl isomerase [Planctomycetes bacterium]|nr:peptidylprolyl isomerase [Planctomycetota bacterium]